VKKRHARATHRDVLAFRLTLEPEDYAPPAVEGPVHLATFRLKPCSAPRMTRMDAWKPSDHVLRYREFKDNICIMVGRDLDAQRYLLSDMFGSVGIRFYLPVPTSWSGKKQREHIGAPFLAKPDFDNLAKAFYDALFEADSRAWDVRIQKRYADAQGPRIEVWRMPAWR
jgi:Holliday junction resolvase RusA-like endonuclease